MLFYVGFSACISAIFFIVCVIFLLFLGFFRMSKLSSKGRKGNRIARPTTQQQNSSSRGIVSSRNNGGSSQPEITPCLTSGGACGSQSLPHEGIFLLNNFSFIGSQATHENFLLIDSTEVASSSQRCGRGRAKPCKEWGKEKNIIGWNELCQPIGENKEKLATQLGYYA